MEKRGTWPLAKVIALIACCVWALGCNFFKDYAQVHPFPEDAQALDMGASDLGRDQGQPGDMKPDASPEDMAMPVDMKPRDMPADMREMGPGDMADLGDMRDMPDLPLEQVDYEVVRATTAPVLDGVCDEQLWARAFAVVFRGGRVNYDNSLDCRIAWGNVAGEDRIFGCCQVSDDELSTRVTEHDGDDIWNDDGMAYIFSERLQTPQDDLPMSKIEININDNPVTRDETFYPGWMIDLSYEADVQAEETLMGTLNDGMANDQGYVLEWSARSPIALREGLIGSCHFRNNERDGDVAGRWHSFGDVLLQRSDWGLCRFIGAR